MLSIRQGRKLIIAHGHSTVQHGDLVTVFADRACIDEVRDQLTGAPLPEEPAPPAPGTKPS